MSILTVLKQEKELLLEMLDTLNREKEALIKDDVKELEKIVIHKEELKCSINNIEEARTEQYGSKRLKEILLELEGPEKVETERLGKDIEDLVFKIQEVNDTNGLLIRQFLNYIRILINAVTPGKPAVYGSSGKMQSSDAASSILNKSV